MIRRRRNTSPSTESSSSSLKTSLSKRHSEISKSKIYGSGKTEPLQPQSPCQPDDFQEEEEEEEEEDSSVNGDQYIESEYLNSTEPNDQYFPSRANTFHQHPSLNSTSKPITQIGPYINIAPFPVFRGVSGECPITHLSRFSKVCRANNVSSIAMATRIFPVTLDNEAALWYDLNIEPYPSLTWEEIKSAFLEAYQKDHFEDQFRSELMMLNQGREESVRSYFLRLQWIMNKWPHHGVPETLLQGIFIDGLRDEFKDWILPQKPDSLDDALRQAFVWERVRSIRPMASKRDLKCGFCSGVDHEEENCEVRVRMRELWIKSNERKLMKGGSSSERIVNALNGEEGEEDFVSLGSDVGESSNGVGNGRRDEVLREYLKHEEEEEEEGVGKKSQCQCSKHRCWKKRLDRNHSIRTTKSDYVN